MTSLQVRLQPSQTDRGADLLVDWFDEKRPSTVAYKPEFLKDLTVSPVAQDVLRVGGVVFVADKTVLRQPTADSWTRDIAVTVPVSDPEVWRAASDQLERTLGFLSGDRWEFSFEPLPTAPEVERPKVTRRTTLPPFEVDAYDCVCLFSGGLDSLAGAIELLESGRQPLCTGHHENGKPSKLQSDLFAGVQQHYGAASSALRQVYLAPRTRTDLQARPFPGARERTTRSRSFLFLAAAAALADAVGPGTPIVMPENGFIGINVPLTAARTGSLSTRTTHPQYVAYISELFTQLGLDHPIENPFRLMTKGEILTSSANSALLRQLASESVSCSHPEAGRWAGGATAVRQGNCGVCYPCLIRGASLHRAGWPAGAVNIDPLDGQNHPFLLDHRKKTGASVRAVIDHLSRPWSPLDVLRNGSIPNGEAREFSEVYERGREELVSWLSSGTTPLMA